MFELIYCSVAKPEVSVSDIKDILNVSRNFNSKNEITGCLLYHNNEFIQILEGEKQVVKDLYGQIKSDKRHNNVMLLTEDTKQKRAFENWTMAFRELNAKDLTNMKDTLFVENFIAFSEFAEKPTEAVKMFWYMAKQLLEEK